MDSGVVVLRHDTVEVHVGKDRGAWSMEVTADPWRYGVPLPLFEIPGRHAEGGDGDPFPPRPYRDPARGYDVPASVRRLIRVLLSHRFEDVSHGDALTFRREPVEMALDRAGDGSWSVRLIVDGSPPLDLPPFHGFAGPDHVNRG